MTIPQSLGLCFAFWDRGENIANDWVNQRCRDLSHFYLNSCFPECERFVHSNVDELLRVAAQSRARYCLVQAHGHLILRFEFYQELEKFIKGRRFLVMGHILDRKNAYYELHHQCFLVDLEVYRGLGYPQFGSPHPGDVILPKPVRSSDNFHDDYTPPWLKPGTGGETLKYSGLKDGWNLVSASLHAGLTIENFSPLLREKKHFLYPEAYTSNFEQALKTPVANPAAELNDGQKRFLSGMRQNWHGCRNSIFIFNTDDISQVRRMTADHERTRALYSVASGFRPTKLLEINGFSDKTEVVYFDYSAAALEFRQRLVETFDGENLIDYLRDHSNLYNYGHYQARPKSAPDVERGDRQFAEGLGEKTDYDQLNSLWRVTQEAFGGPKAFRLVWSMSRRLPHRYIHADLYTATSPLTDSIQRDVREPIVVWWSNSFATEAAHTFLPVGQIDRAYENFEFVLKMRQGATYGDGMTARHRLVLGRL